MIKVMSRRSDWKPIVSSPVRSFNDDPVISGLSVTPSEIARLAAQGIAVNSANASNFLPPTDAPLAPEDRRDADRNSMWELSHRSRTRILKARKVDKSTYY